MLVEVTRYTGEPRNLSLRTTFKVLIYGFLYQDGQSLFGDEIFVKSPQECEKWILYKILHRLSGPIFFLAQIFSMKKIILKIEFFFENYQNL